jgi:hypothetical protein
MVNGIPAYLDSGCAVDMCKSPRPWDCCTDAVKQNPQTGRWFITMGHAGFNSKTNNGDGYATQAKAQAVVWWFMLPPAMRKGRRAR